MAVGIHYDFNLHAFNLLPRPIPPPPHLDRANTLVVLVLNAALALGVNEGATSRALATLTTEEATVATGAGRSDMVLAAT